MSDEAFGIGSLIVALPCAERAGFDARWWPDLLDGLASGEVAVDRRRSTANVINRLQRHVLAAMAARSQGITDPDYVI